MKTTLKSVEQRPRRYSAKHMAKPVSFYYENRDAKSVSIIAEFNGWNPQSHPMERQLNGWWALQVPLPHGHHAYLFLVDGAPALDPHASGVIETGPFNRASVLAVS